MAHISSIPDEVQSCLARAISGFLRVARDPERARPVPLPVPDPPTGREVKPPIRLNLQPARRPVEETDSWSGSVIGVAVLFILYILVMQFLKMPIIVR